MSDEHDPTAAGGTDDRTGRVAGSWPIVVAASAVLVVNLDTMLNIALPAITRAFAVEERFPQRWFVGGEPPTRRAVLPYYPAPRCYQRRMWVK